MGKKRWTTAEQLTWLEARIPAFTESQQKKNSATTFFPETHKAWRELWPIPEPTEADITKWKTPENARTMLTKKVAERVVIWFHNNTRVNSSSTGTRGILKLRGTSKVLHGWQAYQHLYYESFKDEIEKEYKSYVEKCEAVDQKPKTLFEFRNEACQKRYLEATEEVKTEVEEYRTKMREGDESNLPKDNDKQNKDIQSAIEKLPRTLNKIGRSIADQTKWQVTVILGGPSPRLNGKLTTLICHFGTTTDGKTFDEFLGVEGYREHIEQTFDDFLHASFSAEECDNRSLNLDSKESTPQADDGDQEEVDDESEEEHQGEMKTKETNGNIPHAATSQYELERARNIARNREALKKLDHELQQKYGDIAPGFGKPKKTKIPRNKKEKTEEERRVSARLNMTGQNALAGSPTTRTADSTPTANSHNDIEKQHNADHGANSGSGYVDNVDAPVTNSRGESTDAKSLSGRTAAMNAPNQPASPDNAVSVRNHVTAPSANDVASAAIAAANCPIVVNHGDAEKEGDLDVIPDKGNNADYEMNIDSEEDSSSNSSDGDVSLQDDSLGASHKDLDSMILDTRIAFEPPTTTVPTSVTPSISRPSTTALPVRKGFVPPTAGSPSHVGPPISNEPGSIDGAVLVPTPSAPTPTSTCPVSEGLASGTANSVPSQMESSSCQPALPSPQSPTSLSSDAVPSSQAQTPPSGPTLPGSNGLAFNHYSVDNSPPWLSAMLNYLRQVSSEEVWQDLVVHLVAFESRHPPAGKLPTKERPEEVSAWIRRHRKDIVPEFKVSEFGNQWMKWWREIQPEWRREGGDGFILSRQVPDKETWASLVKGGTAGLYTVVMSLSWWVKRLPSEGSHADVWTSVKDVSWVLGEVTKTLPQSIGTKRLGENSGPTEGEPQRKRSRPST